MRTALPIPWRRSARAVRHVTPTPYGRAGGLVRRVYREARTDAGVIAPLLALHSPAPGILLAVWELQRAALFVDRTTTGSPNEAPSGPTDPVVDQLVEARMAFEYLHCMATVFLSYPARPVRGLARSAPVPAVRRVVQPCPVGRSGTELLNGVMDAADAVLGPRLAGAVRHAVYAALAGAAPPRDPALRSAALCAAAPLLVTGDLVERAADADALVVALSAAGASRAAAAVTPLVGTGRATR